MALLNCSEPLKFSKIMSRIGSNTGVSRKQVFCSCCGISEIITFFLSLLNTQMAKNSGIGLTGVGAPFLNIRSLGPPSPPKFGRTNSSPCFSPNGTLSKQQMFGPPPLQSKNVLPISRPPMGIRMRCPSCCRPAGSCCCGCNSNVSASRTFY